LSIKKELDHLKPALKNIDENLDFKTKWLE